MSDLIDRQELQTQLDCVDRLRMITDERVIEVIPRWNVSKIIENLPSAEAVLKGTYEQVRWERDTALEQLKELGYSLGEKPRKSDLISRAEILDYIDNMPSELNAEGHRMIRRIRLTEYITDALPSAERTGHWISDWNKKIKMIDGCPDGSCHCSYCGEWLVASDEYAVKGIYCPNCGARMVSEDDT